MADYKNVLVLYTGGTIGMQRNVDGVYVPVSNALFEGIKNSELHDLKLMQKLGISLDANQLILAGMPSAPAVVYRIIEYWPLLDSSNMSVDDWIRIAKDLKESYDKYDGFVVLHGTDTMVYGASALSFMLENLGKPVVLTGGQVPIFETRNDGRNNFIAALLFAAHSGIPEVCIGFNNKLLRGNRTFKTSSDSFDTFHSPNYHLLAEFGVDLKIFDNYILKNLKEFSVRAIMNPNVVIIRFFPTITDAQIEALLQPSIDGVVLQTYGAGNVPSNQPKIIDALKKAINRGVLMLNVTQCPIGPVKVEYETGEVLLKIGVIPGYDITAEAALMKLSYVLALCECVTRKRELLKTSIRGEFSLPETSR